MDRGMGRRPIGEVAMSPAERQRRRSRELGIGMPFLPQRLPWDDSTALDRKRAEPLDRLCWWLSEGNAAQVAKWLAVASAGLLRSSRRKPSLEELHELRHPRAPPRIGPPPYTTHARPALLGFVEAVTVSAAIEAAIALFGLDAERRKRLAVNPRR